MINYETQKDSIIIVYRFHDTHQQSNMADERRIYKSH